MTYDGKAAIVTGGSTGIGRALAIALAKKGSKVVIADIDLANAQTVAEEIKSLGGVASAYQCDVADEGQVAEVFAKAFEDYGALQFAFINAGVVQLGKLEDLSATDLDWMFKVNVFGAMFCARSFISETRAADGSAAHITFTGSENGLTLPAFGRYSYGGGYNMTKHALHSMADSFRFELENDNIEVSLAIPGGVKTEIMSSVRNRQDKFGGSGQIAMPDMSAFPRDLEMPPNISPDEAADIILKGVADKRFYIPTHRHILQEFMERSKEIEASFD